MSLGEYFNKDDISKMYDNMQEIEEFSGYQKMKNRNASIKEYNWEVVEQLYKMKKKSLDSSIKELQTTLKPQGNSIYYRRKVELINLLDEQRRQQSRDLSHILKATEAKKDDYVSKQVRKIMNEYDIKHPFRGEEYEDCNYYKQHFADKIQYKAANPKSFLGYKRDQRATLDQSQALSEEHLKAEHEAYQKTRMILRYRLYGFEGITRREFHKLVHMGIIKKKENHYDEDGNYTAKAVESATPVSGRGSPAVTKTSPQSGSSSESRGSVHSTGFQKKLRFYEDNSKAEASENMGFKVQPLCPVIFGKQKHVEQKKKLHKKERQRRATLLGAAELNENSGDVSTKQFHEQSGYLEESGHPKLNVELTDTDNAVVDLTVSEIDDTVKSEGEDKPRLNPFASTHNHFPSLKIQDSSDPHANHGQQTSRNRVTFMAKNSPTPRNIIVMPHLSKKIDKLAKQKTPMFQSHPLTLQATPESKGMPSIDSKFGTNHPLSSRYRQLDPIRARDHQTMTVPSQLEVKKSSMMLSSPSNDKQDAESSQLNLRNKQTNPFMAAFVKGQTSIGSLLQSPTDSDTFKQGGNQIYKNKSQLRYGGKSHRTNPEHFKTLKVKKSSVAHPSRNQTLFSTTRSSPFSMSENKQLDSHKAMKQLGNGRINQNFLGKTPVQDYDPRPQKLTEPSHYDTNQSHSEMKSLEEATNTKQLRKALDAISRNIDRMEKDSKEDYKELIAKMVSQNIRDAELTRVVDLLKDIDFAEPEQIISIFEYRQNDEQENIRGAEQVVKEYHSGKFPPASLMVTKKKRKS